jgi:lipid II:glycine glycyltransferase (peptidoglycan interpeptide bridge formation enzyme)
MSAELFLACFKEKIIAANIVIFFGGKATYLHGASNYRYRKLMAPHLLQWSQIKEAKNKGCEIYDFWGIDEEKWPGLTRFKKGFGGEELQYSEGKDFVFSNFWYKTYKILRRILFKKLDI